MTDCPSDTSDIIPQLAPLFITALSVAAFASSQDSTDGGRFTAFGFTTVLHLGYTLVSDWTDLYDIHSVSANYTSATPTDDWVATVLDAEVYVDLAVLALLLLHAFGNSLLPPTAWKFVAGSSAVIHLLDIMHGGMISATVFVAGINATRILDGIGTVLDRTLSFLPPVLRVCCPSAHSILSVAFLVLAEAIGEKTPFGDIVGKPALIAAGIAYVGIYALEYSKNIAGSVGQLVTIATVGSLLVSIHHIGSDITDAALETCDTGTALSYVAASLDPIDFTHVGRVLSAVFGSAALAMISATHIDTHYDPSSAASSVIAALMGKTARYEESVQQKNGTEADAAGTSEPVIIPAKCKGIP